MVSSSKFGNLNAKYQLYEKVLEAQDINIPKFISFRKQLHLSFSGVKLNLNARGCRTANPSLKNSRSFDKMLSIKIKINDGTKRI